MNVQGKIGRGAAMKMKTDAIKQVVCRVVLTLLFCVWGMSSSSVAYAAFSSIDDVRLTTFPDNWVVTSEFEVAKEKIEEFEIRFAAAIEGMVNQLIAVSDSGANKIQINYVLCRTDRDAGFVLRQMVELAGLRNVFLKNDNIVIEIIGTNNQLKKEVVEMSNVSDLQKRKFTSVTLPDNWKIVREISMTSEELKGFSEVVTVPVAEVINQFFLIDRERVQLNYIACDSDADADKVYDKLTEMIGKVNKVVKKGSVVFEIISAAPEVKDSVVKQLDNF